MTVQTAERAEQAEQKQTQRQVVRFAFYKARPEWKALDTETKETARRDFITALEEIAGENIVRVYSTVGTRADADLLIWHIADSVDQLHGGATRINGTVMGRYLDTTYNFLAMTRRSQYIERHVHEGQEGARLRIRPAKRKYIFVYPFVKTRQWYLLPLEERQRMMNTHIEVGHRFPSVRLNTTYSFGLDDQDFVVAFETNEPQDFLDLVMQLRETEASMYTQRDTPIFTGISMSPEEALAALG